MLPDSSLNWLWELERLVRDLDIEFIGVDNEIVERCWKLRNPIKHLVEILSPWFDFLLVDDFLSENLFHYIFQRDDANRFTRWIAYSE